MSRKNAKNKRALRAFLAASSVLILLTAVTPLADASDKGQSKNEQSNNVKGESHGKKADKSTVNSILKAIQDSLLLNGKGKKFENDGKALEAQSGSLLKKLAKLSSGNPAVLSAINAYKSSVDTATVTFQITIKTVKVTYKSALATATTDATKQSAETAYQAAIAAAQQTFDTAIQAANLALKTALMALLPAPTPSPSPSST